MKIRHQFRHLVLLAIAGAAWLPAFGASGPAEAKPAQTAGDTAAVLRALETGNHEQVLALLRAHGLDNRRLVEMKSRLGQTPARAKLREPFLRAAIIGSLAGLKPEELKARLNAAAREGFQPVFWEVNSFGAHWQQQFDKERSRFTAPPIGVLDVGLEDPDFLKFFLWYDRYGGGLHSVVINWERLDNWDFKQPNQQRQANRVMNGLYRLIKARNPAAFVWIRIVWADDNSDVRWLKALTFPPDGLLLWNLASFDSPYEAARDRYRPLVAPACAMVAAEFYGIYFRITETKHLAEIGRTCAANLGAFEKRLTDLGLQGLAPNGLLLKAMAQARAKPTPAKAAGRWEMDPLLSAYEKVGRTNPAWDKPVKEALRLYTEIRLDDQQPSQDGQDQLGVSLFTAIQAGCDDPLIQCLYPRYYTRSTADHTFSLIPTDTQAVEALVHSGYSEAQKFVGCLQAAQALRKTALNRTETPPEVARFRDAAAAHLDKLLKEKLVPEGEARASCQDWINSRELGTGSGSEWYEGMAKPLFEAWPKAGWAWAIKGKFFTTYAWDARGKGLADTVTPEGWKLFFERLQLAQEAYEKAWSLDQTLEDIPVGMLTVELGLGQGRDRMELWFERAMQINSNNFAACWQKLNYLEPKWHGSVEALLEFGRECVNSEKWGGKVPLILYYAHSGVASYLEPLHRAAYWRQPEVWPDLKKAFEKFFKLNPEASSWRYHYAQCAYLCEQWDELGKQLDLLGNNIDFSFFGGGEAYNEMVRRAKAHGGRPQ